MDNKNKSKNTTNAVNNPNKPGEKIVPRHFSLNDLHRKKNDNHKNNNNNNAHKEERRRPEPRPVVLPTTFVIDDHPRAMVLCFDRKAVEDIKPKKYTSGYEIFRMPLQLSRYLYAEEFLIKAKELTEKEFMDKSFIILEGKDGDKLLEYAKASEKDNSKDKSVKQFYHYLAYFLTYAKENDTAVVFDL